MLFCNRFICALLLLLQVHVFAQIQESVSYRHFNTGDGLPSTQIQGLFEDSRGYIWAITERGAARFNGYEFEVFTTKNGLPTNNVLLINEDRHGRMWFMCNNGEYCYLEGDSIRSYAGNKRIASLLRDKLPGPFYFDEQDTLWVTTFSGIQLFKCAGDSVQEFIPVEQKPGELPTYYLRKVGEKLVTLEVGDVTNDNKITTTDNINYLLDVAGECKLACSVQVEKNKWALAGPGGYVIFDDKGNVQAYFDSSPYLFSTLDHDRSGNLWLTNSNGAYRIRNYANGPEDSDVFFEGHFITAVLQDKAGNYWFGDRDNGLFFVPSLDIKVYRTNNVSKQNKIVSIKKFEDDIYYSDAEGIIYALKNDGAAPVSGAAVPSGVSLDFTFTQNGNIILGNKPFLLQRNTGKLKSLGVESTIRKSLLMRNGRCAFALADGIGFLDENENWISIDKTIFKERSNALFEDKQGKLWIGSNGGLYSYVDDMFTQHPLDLEEGKPRIADIVEWNDYIVIASRNEGIIFYKDNKSVVFSTANGLLSNTMDCLEVDNDGRLWLGCAGGIQRLEIGDVELKKFKSFIVNFQKGLPSNEVNDLIFVGDTLYVATNDGMCSILTNSTSLNGSISDVVIETVQAMDIQLPSLDTLFLKYNQNSIRIHFVSLNNRTGDRTVYRYRLAGLHDEWTQSTNRSAEFWSLPPGSYGFEVSAMNEDGQWGNSQFRWIVIEPHFTQTWWFKSLAALIVLMLIGFFFYLFYKTKRRKLIIRAKMSELRQQALNANMNPHFIFNALGSIQHFINTGKGQEANEYLADFSQLIRKNLEINQLTLVPLDDELERLELYLKLEKLRFTDKLDYFIEVNDDLNSYELMILPMLLQPYVENALIHGILPSNRKGLLRIKIVQHGSTQYQIMIIDNGVGMNAAKKTHQVGHKSMALAMNQERLQILEDSSGKEYRVDIMNVVENDEKVTGTCVRLTLPMP